MHNIAQPLQPPLTMMMSLVDFNSFQTKPGTQLQTATVLPATAIPKSFRETQKSNESIGSRLLTAVRECEREHSNLNPISNSSPQ